MSRHRYIWKEGEAGVEEYPTPSSPHPQQPWLKDGELVTLVHSEHFLRTLYPDEISL